MATRAEELSGSRLTIAWSTTTTAESSAAHEHPRTDVPMDRCAKAAAAPETGLVGVVEIVHDIDDGKLRLLRGAMSAIRLTSSRPKGKRAGPIRASTSG